MAAGRRKGPDVPGIKRDQERVEKDMPKKYRYVPKLASSIREMLENTVAAFPDREAYMFHEDGSDEIKSVTFSEFYDITENLGAALTELGYGSSHIACMGENSFDWICAYITVLKSAGVFVPVDKDLPSDDKLHVLNESDATVLFFSGTYSKWVMEHKDDLPNIECFICFSAEEDDGNVLSYKKLLEHGAGLGKAEYDALASDENELKLMVYTSGTTGIAKGVMLSEHNLTSVIYYALYVTQIFGRSLSILPYHHTYEGVLDIIGCIHEANTLCINKSLKRIVKDLQDFKPTQIFIVPAIAEFMHSSILKNIKQQGKEKEFKGAVALSRAMRKVGVDLRPVLFKTLRNVFGGELRKIICGGAPIRPEIGQFFDDIGIYLIGGYGITECSPLVSVNDEKSLTYDTVGYSLPCTQIKIDEPNEEGIGEILVKGDTVMLGYYKQPEKTAEVLTEDGWFSTGDYGYLNKKERLVITGRKKNIIVLSNGKNIYPEEIENYIQNIDYVEEVIVSGVKDEKGDETSLQAEVYLNEPHEEREVLEEIRNRLSMLPSYKNVTHLVIRDEPFPKTSTNKIRRQY